jgi:flavin reductase (DIM6/NTAB) family NADH-FMN oxidoreductase RutF
VDDQREEGDRQIGPAEPFDAARFREVLGHFATGVAVVTTADGDGPSGFSCQAFSALSLDPPLVVFAPSRKSSTWARIQRTRVFCANILSESQEALCRVLATKDPTKFRSGLETWHYGLAGTARHSGLDRMRARDSPRRW